MNTEDPPGRHERKKCGGTTTEGRPCRNPAGFKTDHLGYGNCKFHTGCTPTGIKHAEAERERENVAKAASLLEAHGVTPRDPTEVFDLLGEMVGRHLGLIDLFEKKTAALGELVADGEHGEYERVYLKLYRDTVRDTSALLGAVAKLDIDERRVRLDAVRAEQAATRVLGALERAGVPVEYRDRFIAELGRGEPA